MGVCKRFRERWIADRRARIVSGHLARVLPDGAAVLDVGSGDGRVAGLLAEQRPDLEIRGVDVLVPAGARIEVDRFDGVRLPYADRAFDVVQFVDVLHHTDNPLVLLREAARVARRAVVIKDHLQEGLLADSTLRFLDWAGNREYGVRLPYTFWRKDQWQKAFAATGLHVQSWEQHLGLYPQPASLLLDRSLHFLASLSVPASEPSASGPKLVRVVDAQPCCDPVWEAAYRRFETPEQEIRKFTRRLERLGQRSWPRSAHVVELFCGRGNGMVALQRAGFSHVEGVDLSESLLRQYQGSGTCYVADCRDLPFADGSRDLITIHGGLHHLPKLPEDLDRVLQEARRVLTDEGRLAIVEPWMTPFLALFHFVAKWRLARRAWDKIDASATMMEREAETYQRWLSQPQLVLDTLRKYFLPERCRIGWGKIEFLGRRRAGQESPRG